MGSLQRGNLPSMISLLIEILSLASWTIQLACCKNSPIVTHDAGGGGGGGCSDVGLSTADCASLTHLDLKGFISYDNMTGVDSDWGFMIHHPAAGILYPQSVSDIVAVVQAVAKSNSGLTVAARGHGHSVNGQAQVMMKWMDFLLLQCRPSFCFCRQLPICVMKLLVFVDLVSISVHAITNLCHEF
jgi:hypothetical protein